MVQHHRVVVPAGKSAQENVTHVACSKSIRHDFFLTETNEAQEVCCSREVEGTLMCIRGFFPTSRPHQSHAASM